MSRRSPEAAHRERPHATSSIAVSGPSESRRPGEDDPVPDDDDGYDESDDQLEVFDELNRSTATSTFLDRPWFRYVAIGLSAVLLFSFVLPVFLPLFVNNDNGQGDNNDNSAITLPDFVLPSAYGGGFSLSDEVRTNAAVVLVFYRGYACEECRRQLTELQDGYRDIRAEGAQMVAISVDSPADARRMADLVQASFPVLSDEDGAVTTAYRLFDQLFSGGFTTAIVLLGQDRELLANPIGTTPDDQLPAAVIVDALRVLSSDPGATSS